MTIASSSIPELTGEMQPKGVTLTPSDYFVLSRIDGHSNVRMLSQVTGQSVDAVIDVLMRLAEGGLVRVPGFQPGGGSAGARGPSPPQNESLHQARTVQMPNSSGLAAERARLHQMGSAQPSRPRSANSGSQRSVPGPGNAEGSTSRPGTGDRRADSSPNRSAGRAESRASGAIQPQQSGALAKSEDALSAELLPSNWPVSFDQFVFDPSELSQGDALTTEQKKVVTYVHYHLKRVTYYDLFGIDKSAGRRDVRAGYFRLSKAFHPDRWFRKDVGLFGTRIEEIFKWVNRANSVLGSPKKRKGYDKLVERGYIGEWQLEEEQASRSKQPNAEKGSGGGGEGSRGKASMATQMMKMRARQAQSAGRFGEAAELYRRAVQLDDSAELRISLIECMLKAHVDPIEIRAELSAARSKGAGGVRLLILEGEVARRLGDRERARACFETVLEEDPANPVARLGLERLDETR